jgi:uncharacterized protein YabN with tetrapyrrole methylase and pyrophosphatase domain
MDEETNEEKSLVPKVFSPQDVEALTQLKETFAQVSSNLSQVSSITENMANIAKSMAEVRVSDNKVQIMSQKIAADKEKWHDLLNKTFSGRDKAIDAFIDQITNGTKEKNNDLILKAMDGLSNIVSSSPWPTFEAFNKLIDSDDDIVI